MIDIALRNLEIYNGVESPFHGDVAIREDRIAGVGTVAGDARLEIDCSGLTAVPGLIDAHTHTDSTIVAHRECLSHLMQGVTTAVIGNCGNSAAPMEGARLEDLKKRKKNIPPWRTYSDFVSFASSSGLNFVPLVGQGSLRAVAVGYENRRPSDVEMERMKKLLGDAMLGGAFGVSTGLIYPPGMYADEDEIVSLTRVAADAGGIYTTHMRSEGDGLLDAVQESIRICRGAGLPLHISHFKACLEHNWKKLDQAIAIIEKAQNTGLRVTMDRYPYTALSTSLDALLPDWCYEGGNLEECKRLNDPEIRQKIIREMETFRYYDKVMVVGASRDPDLEGMRIPEIAARMNCSNTEAYIRVLAENELDVGGNFFQMSEDNLERVLGLPYCVVGSDASAENIQSDRGGTHPRKFGTFASFLRKYAGRIMRFEEAVAKVTSQTAEIFNIEDRGVIAEGAFADVAILDRGALQDNATYTHPRKYADGVVHVLLNGKHVVENGSFAGFCAGRILKRKRCE